MRTFLLFLCLAIAGPRPALAQSPSKGILLTREEIKQLPMNGKAWESMKAAANAPFDPLDLSEQDSPANVRVLAAAFVWARLSQSTADDQKAAITYRTKVIDAVSKIPGTESDTVGDAGRTLALGRELGAYVVAIDLVRWDTQAQEDVFKAYLVKVRTLSLENKTLITTQDHRPNNWGNGHAAWSRAVLDVYLGDAVDLARVAKVFRGWLGDRTSYVFAAGDWGDLSWHADPTKPVGINPKGSLRDGHSIDGVLPDDQRRAGSFKWPPPKENYVWECLQGSIGCALVLSRYVAPDGTQPYAKVWEWSDRALWRAAEWLHKQALYPATGDDGSLPWVLNAVYGTNYPAPTPTTPGKGWGFADWWAAEPLAAPIPDSQLTLEFHWRPVTQDWGAHRLNDGQNVDGAGATKDEALSNWAALNKGKF
jgi:hypothetical protein